MTQSAQSLPISSRPTESRFIVPIGGVWIVAAVVVAQVVIIVGDWHWALNFAHVAAGGLWTGIDLFMGFVIGPTMRSMDPPARVAFVRRLMPKMMLIMPTVVLVTLASGWQLAHKFGFLLVPYPNHWWIIASFAIVGLMSIIANAFLQPANITVLLELRKPEPNVLLIGRVMRRFVYTAGATGVLQLGMIIIMTKNGTW